MARDGAARPAGDVRQRIVDEAAATLRREGLAVTGGARQGITRHFSCRDDLVSTALAAAFQQWTAGVRQTLEDHFPDGLEAAMTQYLSARHRDDPSTGCPLAALASELARAGEAPRTVATEALTAMTALVARQLDCLPHVARRRAMLIVSAMVGALTLSRIVNDRDLSDEILRDTARELARTS